MPRRRVVGAARLGAECRWLLLAGWGVPLPDDLAAEAEAGDPWQVFTADLAALWREYRSELMADARRRGIDRPWGMRFDGRPA